MRGIARVGDLVISKGRLGVILTGSQSYFVDGRPVARLGDMTTLGPILTASTCEFIDGRPIARIWDLIPGGCIITGSLTEYLA